VLVDGHGLPLRIVLSPGQASSDKAVVSKVVVGVADDRDLVADRG
jgi:hypothetical protein